MSVAFIEKHGFRIVLLLIAVFSFFLFKEFLLFPLFIFLDIIRERSGKHFLLYIPFEPMVVLVIITAYRSVFLGTISSLFVLFSKEYAKNLNSEHFWQIPVLLILAFATNLLRNNPIAVIGPSLVIFKYLLDFLFDFLILRGVNYVKTFLNLFNLTGGIVFVEITAAILSMIKF